MFNFLIILDLIVFILMVLINIAFITLLERKILGYSQSRLGPNKPSLIGLLQPMADAVKLFLKNFLLLSKVHIFIFWVSPMVSLTLVLWIWLLIPVEFGNLFFLYSLILLLMILSLNVYPILMSGWSSSNKFSLMGALRAVAQTISYEISLALLMMIILIYLSSLSLDILLQAKIYYSLIFICPILYGLWLLSSLAETNRTPFDFSEGESELVSGFNTEYSASGFAMIFMAEYGSIYFLSMVLSLIFYNGLNFFILSTNVSLTIFIWVWARTTFPRYRYDLLMNLAWKSVLPGALSLSFLIMSVMMF